MGRFIIKITDDKTDKDYYLEWSSIVDAPVTYGMSIDEFKKYYKESYGSHNFSELATRIERVERHGTSSFDLSDTPERLFAYNRAGEQETCIDKEGILNKYCR